LLIAGAIISYIPAKNIMTDESPYFYVVMSNITLNFVLFIFLWGIVSDKITKGKSRRYSWIFWGIGMIAIVMFFKFVGGFPTIFG